MGYQYNAAGQQIVADNGTLVMPVSATTNNAFDAANRATTWNGATQTFDNNGNLLNAINASYVWNARNQLVQSSSSSQTNTVSYDAAGRMVAYTKPTTTMHSTLYDGFNSVLMDGTNFSLQGLGLDQNFARINANGAASYLTDSLGSTRMLTDASGAVTATYAYGPYGTTQYVSGTDSAQFLYAGRPVAAGQYYDRNRFYMYTQGRFMSQDPIGLAGGMNMYGYVGGDPISNLDPLGLFCYSSLLPDIVNFNIGLYVFSFSASITRDGNIYYGGGFGRAYAGPSFRSAGVTLSGTYLIADRSLAAINNYAGGFGYGFEAYDGLGGGVGYSPGTGWGSTIGLGFGTKTPGANLGAAGASDLVPARGNYDASGHTSFECQCGE